LSNRTCLVRRFQGILKDTVNRSERALDKCVDFACVFELVKKVVKSNLGMSRGGLMLGLTNLPESVGAFHGVGGNFIVMNRKLLDMVVRSATDRRYINAYVFYILLHEYLHSLGFLSEQQVQEISTQLCEKVLGVDHPATQMAKGGIQAIFRQATTLRHLPEEKLENSPGLEIISDFDRETTKWYV
jgi:hypothetical protein